MVLGDAAIQIISLSGLLEVDLVVGRISEVFGAAWVARFRVSLDETALAEDRI